MLIAPQISGLAVVVLGHFNPLIFRPDWLRDKEIVIGTDFANLKIEIIHSEIVALILPWGAMQVNRNQFSIVATQEPLVRASDFFVKCFQNLPETPITAVGINRDVHFDVGSRAALDRVGDILAPKEFWGEFVMRGGKRLGGLRSLTMEQGLRSWNGSERDDGKKGWIRVQVEPSVQLLPNGLYVQVNDHYEIGNQDRPSDGRTAAGLVNDKCDDSIRSAEALIDRIMGLASETS